ncbi:MAG: serine/threonine-protein kinase [Polyangiaceae bacterium]
MGAADLERGTIIGGRYRIDGTVGRGGMGAVYRAFDTRDDREVALKVLLANYSSRESDSKRFEREASLVKKLDHPNIVELLDYGQTDTGEPYIAFELLHGSSLCDVLKRDGALHASRVVQVTRDIIEALKAAHKQGIVHRDIKPQNVFLCDSDPPRAMVLDFGVAKALGGDESVTTDLTQAGQIIGSPHYMSPEQVRGQPVRPATDIYALGLLIAEMITGERVVPGDSPIEVYMVHVDSKPLPLSPAVKLGVLGPVVTRACSKDPEERYRDASELLVAFESALLSGTGAGETFVMEEAAHSSVDEALLVTHEKPVDNLEATVVMTEGMMGLALPAAAPFSQTVDDFAITVDRGLGSPEELRAAALAALPVDGPTLALESLAQFRQSLDHDMPSGAAVGEAPAIATDVCAVRPPFSSIDPVSHDHAPGGDASLSARNVASTQDPAIGAKTDPAQLQITFEKKPQAWGWIVLFMTLLLVLGFVAVAWWLRYSPAAAAP